MYIKFLDDTSVQMKGFMLLENIISLFSEEIVPFITEVTLHVSRTFNPVMGKNINHIDSERDLL